ncbi:GHKL domain-containing protein, partial [Allofrancisella guangzhouensis]
MNNDQLLKNLNQMLINMPGYVYWKNTHSQYMGCNLNLANLSGLNHPNDIVGKTDYDFYWGENQAQEFINDDKEIFKTGNIKTTVYKLPIKSGLYKYTYIKTDKLPVYDLNNNIVGVLGIALDITEEKHKDENFKKVVSQAVHDIRSPLSSILMISKFNKQIPENIRKAIKSACENINNISENILQKYNPETKEFDFEVESEKELFFPYLTIQEVTANKKFEYLNKNLDIDIEAKNLFFSINGNQGMFRRALSNIINNSIEAATMDPKILISVTSEPDGCHIKITDNGVGIPQEKIDEINNNIFSTSKKTGHGIGLKQVKETIEDMDGRMTINSTVGVGTSIDIVIPESEKLPKWSCNEIKIDLDDLVIILDDEKSMEIAWNNCLKDLNIQPIFFSNYNSLLNSLPEFSNKNIFLITDYELPNQGVSGIDIIDKISPNKKILITSHYNDKKVQEACIERGINIVPKTLLSDIPITVNLENKPAQTNNYITTANLILLDDDYLITDNLKNTFPNKKIVVFNNIN